MPSVDELWAWVRTPVEELAAKRADGRDKPWPELRAFFVDRTGVVDPSNHPLVDRLVREFDEMPDDERGTLLDDKDKFEAYVHELITEVADTDSEAVGQSYDDGEWQRFLIENGPRWAGSEESWPQFRDWFNYQANEAGFGEPATALTGHLGTLGARDRIATLAQYGVHIAGQTAESAGQSAQSQAQQEEQPADGGSYDDGEWQRFLAENGPRWAGSEESWPQFREWFDYHARERGVGAPATALTKYLASMNVPERIATFVQYGVRIAEQPIGAGQAEGGAQPPSLTEADIRSLLEQTTEFDDISEKRRRELIHEVTKGR
jgi:hypothetical protein